MIKKAMQITLGIFIGVILLYLFIYFGGADYLKAFGKKTEQAGEGLKHYEKGVKDVGDRVLEKAKEKVKERMP